MRLTRLRIAGLRGFEQLEWAPQAGINVLIGANGAGKTTLLEAMYLLAYGRSFRGRVHEGLIRRGQPQLEVYAEWERGGSAHRAGLRHTGRRWEGRLDAQPVALLSRLCAAVSMICFEPSAQSLLTGAAELRRRYLDWTLFHVEPAFYPAWRHYARALQQRNEALKRQLGADVLAVWERELALAGETLHGLRTVLWPRLQARQTARLRAWLPELGEPEFDYQPGWRAEHGPLSEALKTHRERDRRQGHTGVGPHRADWRLRFALGEARQILSRGQAKLAALACLLAQADCVAAATGDWPLLGFDDLLSELDAAHQGQALAGLRELPAQCFITGTVLIPALAELAAPAGRFHVEPGRVEALV